METNYDGETNEYIVVSEAEEMYTKQLYWDVAIGLQKVDGLTPSNYMETLVSKNIKGEINTKTLETMLNKYYETKDLTEDGASEEKECDLVSTKIVELINNEGFTLNPISLLNIHRQLFKDIYSFAGEYRKCNIIKKEPILNDNTVNYSNYDEIEQLIIYDFKTEQEFDYSVISEQEKIEHFAKFTSDIWQFHPFREGNTRTIAVFMIKYLKTLGYSMNNDLFKEHSIYFRNALVRSNYSDQTKNIYPTEEYLIKFYENLLLNKQNKLKSRELIVKELF